MTGLMKLAALASIIYLTVLVVFSLIKPVSSKRKKISRDFILSKKNQVRMEKFYYFRDVVIRKVTSNVLLSEAKKDEYRSMIKRLDLKMTPEELRARQIVLSALALLASLVIMQIQSMLGIFSMLGVVLAWLYPVDEIQKKIEKKNKNIMDDFPAFYSMLYYQYSRSVNIFLGDVVKDFLPNANPDMAEELEIFIDNIEYGEEYALKQLKKRVPLRYVVKFCDIMQTRLNGYDNTSQMTYLKNELNDLRIQTLEKELRKRQNQNIKVQFALIFVLIVYVIIYFYYQFMDAFKMFS
ncbi:MAG TPA: hypothetical protein PKW03_10305 [Acetivibrio sp.]|nr:hypothetical protein [Clostridium sp.]HOQ38127.1 hypothetical protein [Acetivibrio sp.]HPT91917.1 hypothetical protein [Acetivibrio sp.]